MFLGQFYTQFTHKTMSTSKTRLKFGNRIKICMERKKLHRRKKIIILKDPKPINGISNGCSNDFLGEAYHLPCHVSFIMTSTLLIRRRIFMRHQ